MASNRASAVTLGLGWLHTYLQLPTRRNPVLPMAHAPKRRAAEAKAGVHPRALKTTLPCRGVPLLPFDWPAWSDAHGSTTSMPRPPEREGERGWFIVRTPGTDDEGWRYGTVFSKITTPRPGGRSSKRSSDYVRTRVWRKLMVDRVRAPAMWGAPWVACMRMCGMRGMLPARCSTTVFGILPPIQM